MQISDLWGPGFSKPHGNWQVAPAPRLSLPIDRCGVRHYLTGTEPIVLTSPELSTGTVGRYRVCLRISDPPPGFDIPVVQYFVGQDKG